jgi:hypothetical protein
MTSDSMSAFEIDPAKRGRGLNAGLRERPFLGTGTR